MEIVFFHRNDAMGYSIKKGFSPFIEGLKSRHNVKEYILPYYGSNPVKLLKNIIYIYKHRTKHGINHISGEVHYGVLGLMGVTSVVTFHDDYALRMARRGIFDKIYKWFFWIYLPVKLSDKVICISEQTLLNISKYVSCNNVIVMPHHVIPSNMYYKPKSFDSKAIHILQIGTNKNKNVETSIMAMRNLRNCTLTVVQKLTEGQLRLANEMAINYKNLYNLTDEEIVEEYINADIVLFPSSYEGFGMIILESQAIGRPVITTNKEPMRWVAGKEGAYFINNPKNSKELQSAILEIINNENMRNKLIANGLDNVKRFALDAVLSNYESLYKKLLDKND